MAYGAARAHDSAWTTAGFVQPLASLLLPSPGETSLMPHTAWTHTPLSLPFLPPQTKNFMRGTLELFDNTGWYNSGCLELCLRVWNVHMRLVVCLWRVPVCG